MWHTFNGLDDLWIQLLVLEFAPGCEGRLGKGFLVPEAVHQLACQLSSRLCLSPCLLEAVGEDVDSRSSDQFDCLSWLGLVLGLGLGLGLDLLSLKLWWGTTALWMEGRIRM